MEGYQLSVQHQATFLQAPLVQVLQVLLKDHPTTASNHLQDYTSNMYFFNKILFLNNSETSKNYCNFLLIFHNFVKLEQLGN